MIVKHETNAISLFIFQFLFQFGILRNTILLRSCHSRIDFSNQKEQEGWRRIGRAKGTQILHSSDIHEFMVHLLNIEQFRGLQSHPRILNGRHNLFLYVRFFFY